MKLMIASDLHGSDYWCARMLEAFETEQPERLMFLGDILYHGPRNDLPREYAPKQVIAKLTPLKDRILCVRGNCDTSAGPSPPTRSGRFSPSWTSPMWTG